MASNFIGYNRNAGGLKLSDWTIGASTGSTDMEFRADTGKSLTQLDLITFLKTLTSLLENDQVALKSILTSGRL